MQCWIYIKKLASSHHDWLVYSPQYSLRDTIVNTDHVTEATQMTSRFALGVSSMALVA